MKKTVLTALTLILFLTPFLQAQNTEADEAYIKAMTAQSPAQRAQLLKEYIAKYAGKGTQYENFAYANLSLIAYPGKTDKETIEYGEKALALGGLDDFTKCQVCIVLSAKYSGLGQNLEKAKSYALQVVEIARANKDKESAIESSSQWNKLIGAGYYAHGQACEKAKDLKGAVDSYINSYNILKNASIIANLKKVGKSLYDFKFYADAEKAFKVAYSASKDYDSCAFYANSLFHNNKKEEALTYFKEAYAKEKSGEMAYNIGILLAGNAKTNPAVSAEALRYLLEASFLSPSKSQQAMQLAENLFFTSSKELKWNEMVTKLTEKSKKIEELTKTFNDKFGNKDEEDLTDEQKKEMKTLQASIDAEKKNLEKLQAEQNIAMGKFNKLIEETKQRLGIK